MKKLIIKLNVISLAMIICLLSIPSSSFAKSINVSSEKKQFANMIERSVSNVTSDENITDKFEESLEAYTIREKSLS